MKSSAAVFRRPDQPFDFVSLQLPSLESGQVLVKVTCCTLCGSDLHTIRGDRHVTGPTVLGHEMIGIVQDLPASGPPPVDVESQPIRIGDRITWSVVVSCRSCFYCCRGLPQKCERLFKYGHEPMSATAPASGGLSEYCLLVDGTTVVKLPESLPDFVACPANCATATVAAAWRTAGGVEGKSVVVHGGGMLGLTMAAMARVEDAACIYVTDPVEERRRMALRFGATEALDADRPELVAQTIQRATQERGADVVFEMSGAATAVERSLDLLRVGGRLVLVGSVFPSRPISMSPERVVRHMIRMEGVHNYRPTDLVRAIGFLQSCHFQFPFQELVGAEYGLDEIDLAVSDALKSPSVRIAVRPNAE